MKKLPYGIQDFGTIRKENYYYVDKTVNIEKLENEGGRCLVFLRPRRFGKSLLISMLEHYYDVNKANNFETIFKGTYIYDNPTPLKNSYCIFRLDFSKVSLAEGLDSAMYSLNFCLENAIKNFYSYYSKETGGEESFKDAIHKNGNASTYFSDFISDMELKGVKIFLLIDEYDNFANNILTQYGKKTYQDITQKGGFVRSFFASVKAGTGSGTIDRMFMTGVSPMLMSDMTSGFNIGLNISLSEKYHNLVGFTENEFEEMISYYIQEGEIKKEDREEILETCKEYYNNYRFSKKDTESVYNSNLVIYYLNNYLSHEGLHENLLDQNILTDYAKLRNIVIYDKQLNGNYSVLSELMTTGKTTSQLVDAFPMEAVADTKSFKSLLFYLGLITIRDTNKFGYFNFVIPNKTVEGIHFSYIRNALSEALDVKFNISKIESALFEMIETGNALPALQIIADTFYDTVSLRDFVERESSFKAYLMAYFSIASFLNIFSEREFNKGYADVYIELDTLVSHIESASFLIELKYVHAKDRNEKFIKELEEQATTQLQSYAKDAYFKNKEVKKYIFILSERQVEV